MGHREVEILDCERSDASLEVRSRRVVDVELPGFARKGLSPTNTMIQTDRQTRSSAENAAVRSVVSALWARAEGRWAGTGCHAPSRQGRKALVVRKDRADDLDMVKIDVTPEERCPGPR
jgi:hypothetical protein